MKKSFFTLLVLSAALSLSSCEDEAVTNSTYALEEEHSTVEWKGHSPNLYHDGSFSVKSQDIKVVDGKIKSGTFTIPIVSIQNFDLPEEMKPVLLEHLKSPDFFHMALHPNASFKITKVEPSPTPSGETNCAVTGDFTMLGQRHAVTFPAMVELEDNQMKIDAGFEIDRTKWGMHYAADPALGEHHILPKVDIKLNLLAHKK
ncbi:YceI family protein [Pontibacter toksunensis]|uniref:YceI family protein n=1 Tax=Pontibacter toksunensis TaxID=1332631 RepID=A0ABW6C0K2_9BACT